LKEDIMRTLTAVIAFVVGFAIAWLILPARKLPVERAQADPLVRVDRNGRVNRPEVRISRTNTVGWALEEGESLQILFPQSRFPKGVTEPPFAGMTLQGTDWAVRCGSGFCFSGKVNEKLPPGEHYYKYDQVVGTNRVDGMIIITP
jgi:hypothetical protein